MPIPDNVAFAPKTNGEDIFYSTVRNCQNDFQKIKYLKARLDDWFVNHIEPLSNANSAFPLAIMTCIGIETIGQIFIKPITTKQNRYFVGAIAKIDQKFSKKFDMRFQEKFEEMWSKEPFEGEEKELKINNNAELIYTFFRNTMIHGYKAKGVYLDLNENLEFETKEGYLILNPKWFWNKFKLCYEKLFKEALSNADKSEHKQSIAYINKLIS